MACAVCGDTEIEIAHFPRSKGAGAGDLDVIPLCTEHHREQHDSGVQTFAGKYIEEICRCLWDVAPVRARFM